MKYSQLGLLNHQQARLDREVYRVILALGIGFSIFGGLFMSLFFLRHGSPSHWGFTQDVLIATSVLVAIVSFGFARGIRRLALNVEIDSTGALFEFERGRPWRIRWDDPDLDLLIRVSEPRAAGLIRGEWITVSDRSTAVLVTPEVYRAVLVSARVRGMHISQPVSEARGSTRIAITRS